MTRPGVSITRGGKPGTGVAAMFASVRGEPVRGGTGGVAR
jgi:hypothetical protein